MARHSAEEMLRCGFEYQQLQRTLIYTVECPVTNRLVEPIAFQLGAKNFSLCAVTEPWGRSQIVRLWSKRTKIQSQFFSYVLSRQKIGKPENLSILHNCLVPAYSGRNKIPQKASRYFLGQRSKVTPQTQHTFHTLG